jgi:hypothetical membrane protein
MPDRRWTWRLLSAGIIGPVLFVADFLIDGWARPGYDPMRMFVSLLSLGDNGWQQTSNFEFSGALIVCGAIGLRRVLVDGPGCRWGPLLIGLAGVGLIMAGIFPTDPAQGYPPGTPPGMPATTSWHGVVHQLASALFFIGLPIAMFVMARRFSGEGGRWALYSLASAFGVLLFIFTAFGLTDLTGLLQRLAIIIALGWVAQIMWRFRRELAPAG